MKANSLIVLFGLLLGTLIQAQPNPAPNPGPNPAPAPAPSQPATIGNGTAPAGNGTAPAGNSTLPAGNGTLACNPYTQVCPNADCTDSDNLGITTIISPNKTAYFYIGVPILVNWTYVNSAENFPVTQVVLYYKLMKDKTWTRIGNVSRSTRTFSWTLESALAGSYEVMN
jgi:hypothetical protein